MTHKHDWRLKLERDRVCVVCEGCKATESVAAADVIKAIRRRAAEARAAQRLTERFRAANS